VITTIIKTTMVHWCPD